MTYARVSGRNPKPPKRYEEKEKKRKRHKSSSAKSVKDSDRYLIVFLTNLMLKIQLKSSLIEIHFGKLNCLGSKSGSARNSATKLISCHLSVLGQNILDKIVCEVKYQDTFFNGLLPPCRIFLGCGCLDDDDDDGGVCVGLGEGSRPSLDGRFFLGILNLARAASGLSELFGGSVGCSCGCCCCRWVVNQ